MDNGKKLILTQLEGKNPDWFSDSKLFLLRYLNIQLKKTFSKIFFIIGSKEIGL